MGDRHVLGLSLAVARDGEIVYAHGYGFADRRRTIRVEPRTVFAVGSIEKQFLAASVLRLCERGRLSLDDTLGRFVPWYAVARDVTVRELLENASGIPDYATLPDFDRLAREPVSPEALVRRVASLPLEFAPGTNTSYSNTNYVLLGVIVEDVTRMPLAAWLHRDLFGPLQLRATAGWNPFLYEPRRAEGSVSAGSASLAFGGAGLESSALDVARWLDDLFAMRVVSTQDLMRMFDGMGFFSGRIGSRRGAWHSGYVPGYSAYVAVVPGQRLAVVLLSNADAVDLGPLAQSVIDDATMPQ